MSKLTKIITGIALAAGLALALPGVAQAQHGGHHGGGGYYHGGGGHYGGYRGGYYGGWGPGFALGLGLGYGAPYYYPPSYYRPPPVYYDRGPDCGWVRTRYWRYGHWHWRRTWRCW